MVLRFLAEVFPYLKITLGNHDSFSEVARYFNHDSAISNLELYYSADDDYIKYLYLDSSSYEIGSRQCRWLIQQISTADRIALFIHHPVLEVDAPVDKIYPLKNREIVKDALLECNKDVTIFCGHYHMTDERTFNNIKRFITPAASYQFRKDSDEIEIDNTKFGYRVITVEKFDISSKVILYHQGDYTIEN